MAHLHFEVDFNQKIFFKIFVCQFLISLSEFLDNNDTLDPETSAAFHANFLFQTLSFCKKSLRVNKPAMKKFFL